ncbi:hypothetical protein X474_09925 [Dethiosulfatarculus sandiegensis]|uniref:Uncharacterized protein n=1 Tax=Dethiosulfatarculus sandiegensis TaxID=1429043 RepID=A0A0D2JY01_9BACT|nr:hypothetical protein X474_09925 [Dethiosulfatarculus sandiegensis]
MKTYSNGLLIKPKGKSPPTQQFFFFSKASLANQSLAFSLLNYSK